MPNADVSHARPLQAVVPALADEVLAEEVKITPNFSFARDDSTRRARCPCVSKETQRWRGRPLREKSEQGGELASFVAPRLAARLGLGALPHSSEQAKR
jgi:hypothetical protein